MKTNLSNIAAVAIASAFITLPAVAQTSGEGANRTPATTTGENAQRYSTETRSDNNRDWGWIGLIGLAGLAGLRRKEHDDQYRGNLKNRTAV